MITNLITDGEFSNGLIEFEIVLNSLRVAFCHLHEIINQHKLDDDMMMMMIMIMMMIMMIMMMTTMMM